MMRRATVLTALAAALTLLGPAAAYAADSSPPAGGAPITDVVLATLGGALMTGLVLLLAWGHRSGRITLLSRTAAFAERETGMPGWVALPSAVATVSLLTALFGMYWDISLHIDVGRDPGPLANPAHYFILAGLFGVFCAGFLAVVLPEEDPGPTSLPMGDGWRAPLGGMMMLLCGGFALIAFPLDDAWHRLFGQDVTLWGPTHLMLIGGAAMSLVGQAVLLVEGDRARLGRHESRRDARRRQLIQRLRMVALCGGFLVGLSTFQAEFDFGVPQFRMIFQPVLIALAAGAGLVATRQWGGRGAAIGAVGFFLVVRGTIGLLVSPVLGEATPHFPLYVVEAGLVELVALAIPARRPLTRGIVSGGLIGTVGLAAEYGWSHVWMPLPWPEALIGAAFVPALAAGVAGGVLGAWMGTALHGARIGPPRAARLVPLAAAAVVAAAIGFGLLTAPDRGVSASVTLTEARPAPRRAVEARVAIHPSAAARDADWLTVTAWQGGGLVVDRLERVGGGVYRTTEPIPVHGEWKSEVRLHSGDSLLAMPIYLPEDRAIPAAEVPAPDRFSRDFVPDKEILQREARSTSGPTVPLAYGSVLALAIGLLAMLGWGLDRVAGGGTGPAPGARAQTRPPTATSIGPAAPAGR